MVRMCKVMTFALATAAVAGGASAADKAIKASAEGATLATASVKTAAPQNLSARNVVEVDGSTNGALFAVTNCSCLWDNGSFVNDSSANGQASHVGGDFEDGAQAADDFYLCEGNVYKLNSITGTLINNSFPGLRKAKLEIYADCNGCPKGLPLYTLTEFTQRDLGAYAWNSSFNVIEYTFPVTSTNVKAENRSIYLKGGTYWVSLVGLTDGLGCTMKMYDSSYWGISSSGVKGSVAKKRAGIWNAPCDNVYSFPDAWEAIDTCCIECNDLSFVVCADECKILIDNGVAESRTGLIGGSPSQFAANSNLSNDSRSADDFVVPPCTVFTICYLEGCVYTNCDPTLFKGAFEIYSNDCRVPSYLGRSSTKVYPTSSTQPNTATKIIDLGFAYSVNGKPYQGYKLEFHNLNVSLTGGKQYWISIGVLNTFSINEKAFFCYNFDCDRTCLVRFNAGQYLAPYATKWVQASTPARDFSFLIAGKLVKTNANGTGATGSGSGCAADFNGDGKASTTDIFDFLAAWFAGCPQ